jgi:hypothetical protein
LQREQDVSAAQVGEPAAARVSLAAAHFLQAVPRELDEQRVRACSQEQVCSPPVCFEEQVCFQPQALACCRKPDVLRVVVLPPELPDALPPSAVSPESPSRKAPASRRVPRLRG